MQYKDQYQDLEEIPRPRLNCKTLAVLFLSKIKLYLFIILIQIIHFLL